MVSDVHPRSTRSFCVGAANLRIRTVQSYQLTRCRGSEVRDPALRVLGGIREAEHLPPGVYPTFLAAATCHGE